VASEDDRNTNRSPVFRPGAMHAIRGTSLRLGFPILALAFGLLAPGPALADETIATVAAPTPVSAHAGRLAWSSFDPARSAYVLMTRVGGVSSEVPVRPRSVPFDVDLGPDVNGDTVAAYSRCSREPPRRNPAIGNVFTQLPDWAKGRGCDLYKFDFATGRETRIATANSLSGSEFLPSIWEGRVAFARVYERRRGRAGERPYLYVRALEGAGRSVRIPAGTRSKDRFCSGRPRRCKLLVEPGPTTLDLWGRRLALGWDSGGPSSTVYLETIRGRRATKKLISRVSSGNVEGDEIESPAIVAGQVGWVLARFGDTTGNTFERYRIKTGERSEAALPPPAAQANDPYLRGVFAAAISDSTVFYLLSGGSLPGEPCTPQARCIVAPACSATEPCQLRSTADIVFARTR
jgi:hypothetical protein